MGKIFRVLEDMLQVYNYNCKHEIQTFSIGIANLFIKSLDANPLPQSPAATVWVDSEHPCLVFTYQIGCICFAECSLLEHVCVSIKPYYIGL